MAGRGALHTPHGTISVNVNNLCPLSFTLDLVANTAKTLRDTDFEVIDTHEADFAVILDRLEGPKGVKVSMYPTAVQHVRASTESRFGPEIEKPGYGPMRYPIKIPFYHAHDQSGDKFLTFIADEDCTIYGSVLQLQDYP